MRLLFPMLALALSACQVEVVAPIWIRPSDGDVCRASEYRYLVGDVLSAGDRYRLPRPNRVIAPGDAITEDYSPARLNVILDGRRRVTHVYCG